MKNKTKFQISGQFCSTIKIFHSQNVFSVASMDVNEHFGGYCVDKIYRSSLAIEYLILLMELGKSQTCMWMKIVELFVEDRASIIGIKLIGSFLAWC